jgi:hypothetical protein
MLNKIQMTANTFRTPATFFILIFTFIPLQAQPKMQSGSWSFNQSVEDYTLDKNSGDREMILEISFEKSFDKIPKVYLSIAQLDASKETNLRYRIETVSISRDGFTLKVSTWSDSIIFSISGYWFAYTE